MNEDIGFYIRKASANNPTPDVVKGESGYFSSPQQTLDPHIFDDNEKIKSSVRTHIISSLINYWKSAGYHNPAGWSNLWLAGSGITYQWAGARGNGDLDVLMGFDYIEFLKYNPSWQGLGEVEIVDWMNTELKDNLWPQTANTDFNGQIYEVTYYLFVS